MTPIMRQLLLLLAVPVFAADLPPDKGSTIPESGKISLSTEIEPPRNGYEL